MALKRFPALLLIILLAACAKPSDLEYVGIDNINVLKWGLSTSDVGMDLKFYNPNRQRFQLREADIEVHINGEYLGRAILDTMINVPNRDTFSIPLTMSVSTLTAAANLVKTFRDSTVQIQLEGNTRLGKSGLVVKYPIKYQGSWKNADLLK